MKSNLFTKIVAWLLCALLVIGYLPNVALANGYESEIDVIEQPLGSEANPEEISEGETEVSAADGHYYKFVAYSNGYLTVDVYGEGDWEYSVANGDLHKSSDEEVVTSETVKYAVDDVVIIYVKGNVTLNLACKPEEVILPSGNAALKMNGALLTLESDLTLSVVVKPEVTAEGNYTDLRLEVVMPDKTVVLTEAPLVSGKLRFSIKGIAPKNMNDTLLITLYGTYKGVEYSKSTTYSVASYCYNMLNKDSTNINLKAVLVNLLNFGSAQQVYGNYNPENLSNANLTDTHKSYVNNGELVLANNRTMTGTDNGAKFAGAGLSVNEAVEIYYAINCADVTGVTLELDANGQHYTIEASEFTEKGGTYYAYFKELKANHMRTIVTAGIYRDGQLISKVATYSIETYAASKINGGDALAELVKMMMYYGDSAKYYIENK